MVAPRALAYLAAKGFDPIFGGRPVKRVVQRELETPLARALLRSDFQVGGCALQGRAQQQQRLAHAPAAPKEKGRQIRCCRAQAVCGVALLCHSYVN